MAKVTEYISLIFCGQINMNWHRCFDTDEHWEWHLACKNWQWWDTGIVNCLELGTTDLLMQLMTLSLCLPFHSNLEWFTYFHGASVSS